MKTKKRAPRLVSTGFIALDIVIGLEDPLVPRFYAGGTTGNVTAALAYMGWESTPIGRLAEDEAGQFVKLDLERWGVDTRHLSGNVPCPTPIVIEKIFFGRDGSPKHRFLWTCPDCGAYLPSYRPVLVETIENLKDEIPKSSVFFTDRVSRSIVNLAEHCKRNGAVIVFEPSGVGDPVLFAEMIRICDVLKYSEQRAKSFSELLGENGVQLEIQTLGDEGLRFLLRGRRKAKTWIVQSSCDVEVKDTAGAGDWTTAGLISRLFADGRDVLKSLSKENVSEALQHGQALAALNCQFEGARGAMYQISRQSFWDRLKVLTRRSPGRPGFSKIENRVPDRVIPTKVCPSCIEHNGEAVIDTPRPTSNGCANKLPLTR
ncbi:MAG TPA: PfkB family carbohydrate kinase [Alloacidobacterium sp.]|nr:PfkB family carbohydrate kinase [Alloacidobacterium sp.]